MQGCDPSVGLVDGGNRDPWLAWCRTACRQEPESGGVASRIGVLAWRVRLAPGLWYRHHQGVPVWYSRVAENFLPRIVDGDSFRKVISG